MRNALACHAAHRKPPEPYHGVESKSNRRKYNLRNRELRPIRAPRPTPGRPGSTIGVSGEHEPNRLQE